MNARIEVIDHQEQRYETVGDWYFEGETLVIKVSQLGDWRQEALVAIHELIEVALCKHAGVSTEEVDAFDKAFEKDRAAGHYTPQDEPGDSAAAPYYRQHQLATGVERILAAELCVDWNQYAKNVEQQSNGKV